MVTDRLQPNGLAMWFGPAMPRKAYTQITNNETACTGILWLIIFIWIKALNNLD